MNWKNPTIVNDTSLTTILNGVCRTKMEANKIICGSAKTELAKLPAESINCCISSPPYWALRDYGVDGQLGLEPTFEEYIGKLCDIYDEVKRVLRKDGTCFVNLGDTYRGPQGEANKPKINPKQFQEWQDAKSIRAKLPAKSLCLIPQHFAIEMVNRGWILRNVIIWHKPNPMPSSAKDRFTVDFEYVYFFVKQKRYWFEPQYEPCLTESNAERPRMGQGNQTKYNQKRQEVKQIGIPGEHSKRGQTPGPLPNNSLGRNKRTVWTIPTQACPEAHFATFPKKLVEPMIKAGCPEFVCKKCGKAREKVYEASGGMIGKDMNTRKRGIKDGDDLKKSPSIDKKASNGTYKREFKGYTDCGCNAEWRPGVCLDMFRRHTNRRRCRCKFAA